MMKTSAKQMQVLHYIKLVVLFCLITSVKSESNDQLRRIRRSSSDSSAECIRYELHEPFGNGSKVDSVMRNCQSHSGYLDKLTRFTINRRTSMVNVTFECCVEESFSCQSDLDCPFNFNCDIRRKECIVAECILTDDLDSVTNEGSSCIFDEDCLFFVPQDTKFWGCIATCAPGSSEINRNKRGPSIHSSRGRRSISNSNDHQCITRQCKRCPSTPRVIFNATGDFNHLVEVFLDNSLESNSPASPNLHPHHNATKDSIPPLAILLNSTAFAIDPPPTHYYWRRQTLNSSDITGQPGSANNSSFATSPASTTLSTPSPDETRRNIADEDTSDEVLASILTSTNVSNVAVSRESSSLDLLASPLASVSNATASIETVTNETSTLNVAANTGNSTNSTNSLDNGATNVNSTIHTFASVAAITLTTSTITTTTTTTTEAPAASAAIRTLPSSHSSSSSSSTTITTTTAATTENNTISTNSTTTTTRWTSTSVAPNASEVVTNSTTDSVD